MIALDFAKAAVFCYTGINGSPGGNDMALEYTEEKLNSLDKEAIIQLFLIQQEQLKQIDHHLQLVLEQLADLKRHRFGRSSEKHGTDGQISFMEVDGQIVFFNEAEAVSAEAPDGCREDAPDTSRRRPKIRKRRNEIEIGANLCLSYRFAPILYRYGLSTVYFQILNKFQNIILLSYFHIFIDKINTFTLY